MKELEKLETPTKPNFIIFLTDDLGYNDIEPFGAPRIKTPNLNKMAQEGMKFTNFYAQPVCGPSRAALFTGSYPIRIGEPQNIKNLHTKLHPNEITIAEILKTKDYKTACIGKWHVGRGGKVKCPTNRDLIISLALPDLTVIQN